MHIAARQTRIDHQRCCLLAPNELDETLFPCRHCSAAYTGQAQAARGCRFLKAPQFLASPFSRKKPERLMALLLVRTVCSPVYAALESRIRTALKAQEATFPDHKGTRLQHPTARWGFHDFVGMPGLYLPGQGLMILHLTDEHQHLLQLLGKRYAMNTAMNLISILGPAHAGALLACCGPHALTAAGGAGVWWSYLVLLGLHLLQLWHYSAIRLGQHPPTAARTSVWQNLLAGMRYSCNNPGLWTTLVLAGMVNMVAFPLQFGLLRFLRVAFFMWVPWVSACWAPLWG